MKRLSGSIDFIFWIFLIVFLLLIFYSRLQFLHIPFERDEGEYAYVAQLILQGYHPYLDAYNMKFPGTYFMYALFFLIGGESVETIRYGTLIMLIVTSLFIFSLAKKMFDTTSAFVAVVFFTALNATFGGEGIMSNAEHFVMFFVIAGIYFLFKSEGAKHTGYSFLAGLFLATSVIVKQPGYAFFLYGCLFIAIRLVKNFSRVEVKKAVLFFSGGLIPALLLQAYIMYIGAWDKFQFLVFDYGFEYANLITPQDSGWMWNNSLNYINRDAFPISHASVVGLFLLFFPLGFSRRWHLLLLMTFSLLAISAGGYFRIHYFIFGYFGLAMILSSIVFSFSRQGFYQRWILRLTTIAIISSFFLLHKADLFPSNTLDVFNKHYEWSCFPDAPKVAEAANKFLKKNDRLAMFSNDPQIYFHARRVGVSGWLYEYPLFEKQRYAAQMLNMFIKEVELNHPDLFICYYIFHNDQNHETQHAFEDWWNKYQTDFKLQMVYYLTSSDSGHFITGTEMENNHEWKSAPHYAFWLRKDSVSP